MTIPIRVSTAALESLLAGLGPAWPTRTSSLPSPARCRDLNSAWRLSTTTIGATTPTHAVIGSTAGLGERRQGAKGNGDVDAFWRRLKEAEL